MPHRAASPAVSDAGPDILDAIAGSDPSSDTETIRFHAPSESNSVPLGDDSADEAFILGQQNASNRKASNLKGKTVKKGGGFQAMGLNSALLKAITKKGFTVPTPIQRKTLPLVLDGRDVVAMARTGSGKTACFVLPMIQKLKAHSARVGARACILSPSRELAFQTLKAVKDFGRGTDLRSVLLVGGDSLDDQFSWMSSNPDIIVATPGRFMHLITEMQLSLSSITYMVFDEADRLFELGFQAQLSEILHSLPSSRQTLLFSATLPNSLVEFAQAGLNDPKLVRLDVDSKLSPDLQNAFFSVKSSEKEGALLHILEDIIKVPTGTSSSSKQASRSGKDKKRKQDSSHTEKTAVSAQSTIVFVSTKHHVEYLASFLRVAGWEVSHIYSSLDQTARRLQVDAFRAGQTKILVVTDVAARGVDLPLLANVINYDFPPQPKLFVHRVGRTARAGSTGWSYNLIQDSDVPYFLDLQLFLARRLVMGRQDSTEISFADDLVLGALQRDRVEKCCEWATKVLNDDNDLALARITAAKGEKLYKKTRNSASGESARRAKEILSSKHFAELNRLFEENFDASEAERETMISRISGYRPTETVFEIGRRGHSSEAEVMRRRREAFTSRIEKNLAKSNLQPDSMQHDLEAVPGKEQDYSAMSEEIMDLDPEDEVEVTAMATSKHSDPNSQTQWQDAEHFMSYVPKSSNLAEEKGYGVLSGSRGSGEGAMFLEAARGHTLDINNDEAKGFSEASRRKLTWDKKSKKYVANADREGPRKGMIIGESGRKIAASFRSGRFEAWKKNNAGSRPQRVGELEKSSNRPAVTPGTRTRKESAKMPPRPDKFRDDYHKQRKRYELAKENQANQSKGRGGKGELQGVDKLRKQRMIKEKRKQTQSGSGRKGKK